MGCVFVLRVEGPHRCFLEFLVERKLAAVHAGLRP